MVLEEREHFNMISTYNLIMVRSKSVEVNTPNRNYVGKMRLPSVFAFVPRSMLSHQLIANFKPTGLAKSISQLGSSAHETHVKFALKPYFQTYLLWSPIMNI